MCRVIVDYVDYLTGRGLKRILDSSEYQQNTMLLPVFPEGKQEL